MKIDQIDLYHVSMPLIYPWRTAYGEDAEIHSVLCRMVSGSVEAWGESSPLAAPCYSPEWGGGIYSLARDWMGPLLINQDIKSGDDLQNRLSMFKGNPFAKAIFDNTWWCLKSRIENKPLHELLGATRNQVCVGGDLGIVDSIDDLVKSVDELVEKKYPRIKLKFRPGWDIPILDAVRKAHPDHPFHIDCNSGYRLGDIDLFHKIDDYQLEMIEQPLQHDDLNDHAKLQSQIKTPVCLDESISHPLHVQQAIQLKSCQYVNIKPGRVGGLTNALKIHDLCQEANIPCWVGGMLESATGVSICISLSMLDNFTYPADIFASNRFYHEDMAEEEIIISRSDDNIPSVNAPTHIPAPHPERLKKWTLQQTTLK